MKLIIDAYNILKQVNPNLYITEKERTQFVNRLIAYAHKKGIEIIVVFDGAPSDNHASSEHKGRVTVVYAGHATQADTFIQKYVSKYKAHELLLVSTDRALCAWVAQYKVESIDALAFYAILRNTHRQDASTKSSGGTATKLDTTSGIDIDRLMEEASGDMVVKDAESEDHADRSSPSYTPSKKERALLKKIKKL